MDTQQNSLTIEEKLELIRLRAIQFGLTRHDLEDAVQEIMVDLLEFTPDPEKTNGACESTILIAVIDRRLMEWLRTRKRYQNMVDRCADLSPANAEIIPEALSRVDTCFDVQETIAGLPEFEQSVCQLLSAGNSVFAIARELNCDRRHVQQAMETIRARMADAGLGEME